MEVRILGHSPQFEYPCSIIINSLVFVPSRFHSIPHHQPRFTYVRSNTQVPYSFFSVSEGPFMCQNQQQLPEHYPTILAITTVDSFGCTNVTSVKSACHHLHPSCPPTLPFSNTPSISCLIAVPSSRYMVWKQTWNLLSSFTLLHFPKIEYSTLQGFPTQIYPAHMHEYSPDSSTSAIPSPSTIHF